MKTNVRSYTDVELIERAKQTQGFKGFPEGYWLYGIRSNEDEPNKFDDKIYLFKGDKFAGVVTSATTNCGTPALKGFEKYNSTGAFVLKSDFWHHDMWTPFNADKTPFKHKGKIIALGQAKPVVGYRDGNKNDKSEELGDPVKGWFGINFHPSSYNLWSKIVGAEIGWWSAGCQVVNDLSKYRQIMDKVKNQKRVTYLLINEF